MDIQEFLNEVDRGAFLAVENGKVTYASMKDRSILYPLEALAGMDVTEAVEGLAKEGYQVYFLE